MKDFSSTFSHLDILSFLVNSLNEFNTLDVDCSLLLCLQDFDEI